MENNTNNIHPDSWHSAERLAEIVETITLHTEPLCLSLGLELVHVEFQREAFGRIMRIYIDKDGGVSLNDCSAVSQRLGDLLDVVFADDEIGPYNLEVTSPGLERPLSKLPDYIRFTGSTAKVRLKEAVEGRKNLRGKIVAVKGEVIIMNVNQQTVEIPFTAIAKARLVEEAENF